MSKTYHHRKSEPSFTRGQRYEDRYDRGGVVNQGQEGRAHLKNKEHRHDRQVGKRQIAEML
jgi:hypothetical protein